MTSISDANREYRRRFERSRLKRAVLSFGLAASCVVAWACDGSGGSTAPATILPVRGAWVGSTSQNAPVQLTIDAIRDAPGVVAFSISFTFDESVVPEGGTAELCSLEEPGPFEIVDEVEVAVQGPGFSLTFPGTIELGIPNLSFRLDGQFDDADSVGGEFEIEVDAGTLFGVCGARVLGTWTASPE